MDEKGQLWLQMSYMKGWGRVVNITTKDNREYVPSEFYKEGTQVMFIPITFDNLHNLVHPNTKKERQGVAVNVEKVFSTEEWEKLKQDLKEAIDLGDTSGIKALLEDMDWKRHIC
jgi:UV DNA damage repair endonuclease